MRRLTTLVVLFALASLVPGAVNADPVAPAPGIRGSIGQVRFTEVTDPQSLQSPQPAGANRRAQKAKAAVGLGFFGMLTGSWLGAAMQGNCRCDDPGLAGAMIGAPLGAVVGAILGWHLGR